jgi:uncharacterized SAM-binding protein YcdF (DUF218 family)
MLSIYRLSRSRKLAVGSLILVALAALLFLSRARLLAGIGDLLVIHDRLEPADLILLLNGDVSLRPTHAAALYKQGLAPAVIIARAEDSVPVKLGAYQNVTDSCIRVLEQLGVPQSRIIQLRPPGGVSHTSDEAKALLVYYREHPFGKVIIVTSDLHSRRARFIFHRLLSGTPVRIMLAPVSDLKYGASDWWKTEDGVIGCQNEYIKLLYYHLRF